MRRSAAVAHHLTIDVEEYYQVSAFEARVPRWAWERYESRVERGMSRLEALLDAAGVRTTLFVLGQVAARHPRLVRGWAESGHEVASHGWDHRRVTSQERSEFRDSVRRTKRLLEDLTGAPVVGYRAPSFSIIPGGEWALDVLLEEGYRYDSSLFPAWRPGTGYPGGARDPHWLARPGGRLVELPPATLRWARATVPAGGGAYLRLFPLALVRSAVRSFERRGVPATLYVHPWELDPEQPRLGVAWPTRVRHYGGLRRTEARIRALLGEFRFRPAVETVDALAAAADRSAVPAGPIGESAAGADPGAGIRATVPAGPDARARHPRAGP